MSNLRWEVNYDGTLVWREAATLSTNRGQRKVELIKELFERDGWNCEILDSSSKFIKIKLTNSHSNEIAEYNVVLSNVVNEYRKNSDNQKSNSSYEKRIQGQDFQEVNCTNKLVFGLYVIEDGEDINNSIIVSWPEEILTSGSNRAYRVNTKENIQPARLVGLYADQSSAYNVVTFKPENIYLYLKNKEILHRYNNVSSEKGDTIEVNESTISKPIDKPYNRILFGAPGTGKSFKLNEDRKVYFTDDNYTRVTFHPNYSYAQFVGTYKPTPKEDDDSVITYKYIPGPFMKVLVRAYRSMQNNDGQNYLLIIEEINRANVAAVFGDVFQLLDRKDGVSEYYIYTSEDIKRYLDAEFSKDIPENEWYRTLSTVEKDKHINSIRLPSNMYIWSTMNSADQGVFPIDTAFKRRWDFEYISINESESKNDVDVTLADGRVINWNVLRHAINNKLGKMHINEDKMIGPFFLSKDDLENNFDGAFKSKLLMYLYEDVIKHRRDEFFANGMDTYSKLLEAYKKTGGDVFMLDLEYMRIEPKETAVPENSLSNTIADSLESAITYETGNQSADKVAESSNNFTTKSEE